MSIETKVLRNIAVASLVVLAACASPPKVRVDKDTNVNFGGYKTFAWLAPEKQPVKAASDDPKPLPGKDAKADATPEANSLMENRVRAAVIAALQAKGYSLSDAAPDFRVSYVFNMYERPKDSGMRIGIGAGGGSGRVGADVGLSIPIGKTTNTMGAMTIDIIDTARNAQVWTGSYEDKVEDTGLSDASAQKLVTTILARFPTDPAR